MSPIELSWTAKKVSDQIQLMKIKENISLSIQIDTMHYAIRAKGAMSLGQKKIRFVK